MQEEKTEVVHFKMTAADNNSTTTDSTDIFPLNHHRSQTLPSLSRTTNDLSIFPPINHEGLRPIPLRTPLPTLSDDSYYNLSPPRPNYNIGEDTSQLIKLFKFSLRFCNSNLLSFFSRLRSSTLFSCLRPVAASASVFLFVWFWLRRRWRHNSLAGGGDNLQNIEHLKSIIKAKDEIIQLLERIAEMNKLLLVRHRIPVKKAS